MKNRLLIVCALLALLIAACRKVPADVWDYYPKVETTSAQVLPDGSLQVTGNVLSSGEGQLALVGFCLDTVPNPDMSSHQLACKELNGTSFTANYAGLSSVHTYYLRSWAINDNGYTYGNELVVVKPGLDPANIPCSPLMNAFSLQRQFGSQVNETISSVTPVEVSSLGWRFEASTSEHTLRFIFGRRPGNGVYTVVSSDPSSDPNSFYVHIECAGFGIGGYDIEEDAKVYITEPEPGKMQVVLCKAKVDNGNDDFITTRFIGTR